MTINAVICTSLLLSLAAVPHGASAELSDRICVIPQPAKIQSLDGSFKLSRRTAILVDDKTDKLGRYLARILSSATYKKGVRSIY